MQPSVTKPAEHRSSIIRLSYSCPRQNSLLFIFPTISQNLGRGFGPSHVHQTELATAPFQKTSFLTNNLKPVCYQT